jgi:hypothetical protein
MLACSAHTHLRTHASRYNTIIASGVRKVYYGRGENKFGAPAASSFRVQASTVAGTHPTPLGLRELARFASNLVTSVLLGSASDSTPIPTALIPPWVGPHPPPPPPPSSPLVWVDAATLGVEGKGWGRNSSAVFWQRLPDSAKAIIPKGIWTLSQQPSGVLVRFRFVCNKRAATPLTVCNKRAATPLTVCIKRAATPLAVMCRIASTSLLWA